MLVSHFRIYIAMQEIRFEVKWFNRKYIPHSTVK